MRIYRKSQVEQMEMPFLGEIPVNDVSEQSVSPELLSRLRELPRTPEMLEELTDHLSGCGEILKTLGMYGYEVKMVDLKDTKFITVMMDDGSTQMMDVEYCEYPAFEDAKDWVGKLYDHEVYSYIEAADYSKEFWAADEMPVLYHATDEENVESILKNGLEVRSESRALSNRGTGAAVFTSDNIHEIDNYGPAIFEIHTGLMKQDGYTPEVSMETPLETEELKAEIAAQLGVEYERSGDYHWEGLYPSTVIFYDDIPAKYLTLLQS